MDKNKLIIIAGVIILVVIAFTVGGIYGILTASAYYHAAVNNLVPGNYSISIDEKGGTIFTALDNESAYQFVYLG